MHEYSQFTDQLLTPEEAIEVDRALLTSRDKFLARVAIYSLRILKQIAQDQQKTVENITPDQIRQWMEQDAIVQQIVDTDESFYRFFTQLVLSAVKPLHQAAAAADTSLEDLSMQQVITWFEQQAKTRLTDPQ